VSIENAKSAAIADAALIRELKADVAGDVDWLKIESKVHSARSVQQNLYDSAKKEAAEGDHAAVIEASLSVINEKITSYNEIIKSISLHDKAVTTSAIASHETLAKETESAGLVKINAYLEATGGETLESLTAVEKEKK
jgi:hypothetical protein